MPLPPGARLGAYQIVDTVGSGGMGEVYRAHDPRLGRDVALKVLPASLQYDPDSLERFAREARAVAALNHPHIVTIYSTEEADGVRFLTMELIEGRTLDHLVPPTGVSFALFFDVAIALADALSAAHQKQITHRDLKPANVMVTDAGRVKVLDFGLARDAAPRTVPDFDLTRGLTQAGSIVGTMPYMSPEQIEARPVDGRSDIFSLGIVLYEMATGARPFNGDTSPSLISSILKDHPPSITSRRPDIPEGIPQLVVRCLEKDPKYRVQTAQEILIELRALRRAWESGAQSSRSIRPPSGTSTAEELLRVAVLPFTARPASGDTEALAEGLTDDITAGLARFPILRVVSRQDAQRVSGQDATSNVAAALAARYLLEGSVRASGDRVRITARLVDSRSGTHLWVETFERAAGNLFALQDDVADRIIASVADSSGALVRSMAGSLRDKPLAEHTPFELVIRYEAYNQHQRSEEQQQLLSAFETIVTRHPGEAEAWACLAALALQSPDMSGARLARAKEAIRRALELDSACQRAWAMSAFASTFARDLSGLRIAVTRVVDINRLDTSKLALSAILLIGAGDSERAGELARAAQAYHPNAAPWYRYPLFCIRYLAGEYAEAFEEAKRGFVETNRIMVPALAIAAGKVGSAVDARLSFDAMKALGQSTSREQIHQNLLLWFWDASAVERFMEGYDAALALVDGEASPPQPVSSSGARPKSSTTDSSTRRSVDRVYAVAVTPFTASSTDEDSVSLAQGLTEDIGTGLSRFQHLRVLSAGDARYLVEGTVRRAGASVRVSVKAIDTDSGVNVWAEHYDRRLGETSVFDLQDEITARAVAALATPNGILVRAMAAPLRARPIEELTTHEVVLRALLYTSAPTADEHARLRAALERIVAVHPDQALAWAALGLMYDHEIWLGFNTQPDAMVRATRAARRSVEVDPTCQYGWQRVVTAHFHTNDLNAMQNAADRLLTLNPLNTHARGIVGMVLATSGDWEHGIPMVRQVIDIDAHHPGVINFTLFFDHYRKGEFEAALAAAKRISAFESGLVGLSQAAAAGQLGRTEDARSAFETVKRAGNLQAMTPEAARTAWAVWIRDDHLLAGLLEGLEKARVLVESQVVGRKSSPSGRRASIAVLPFTDMSAERDQEWFCDGVAEEVLNALSQLKGLTVAARASAFSFRGKGDDLKAIGDRLHVTTVLDGSVRRAGDQVRITVRLSDVANGFQIWSERYDRGIRDIFNVQDEIAKTIAERLRVTLGSDPASVPHVIRHTDDQEAYHFYLRGRHHWYARSKGALQKALDNFENAARLDPNYALAHAGLADLYTAQAIYAYAPEAELAAKSRSAVERALSLNGDLSDVHRAAGFNQLFFAWDQESGVRSLQRAIELDPGNALAHAWLGWPTWPGRRVDPVATVRRAQEIDPLNPYVHALSSLIHSVWVSSEAGIAEGMKAMDLDPNHIVGLYILGGTFTQAGRHEDAIAAFEKASALADHQSFFVAYLAWARAMAGRTSEARAGLAELEARAVKEYVSPLHLAIVHAALGDRDRGFELLDAAVRAPAAWIGSPRMPMFDGFRGDPRFNAMLRRIGHPDHEQRDLRV